MEITFPLSSILTLVCLMVYMWAGILVGRARSRLGIKAPATTGSEEFERIFRAHVNTLEQIVVFLPAAWIFAKVVGDQWAALAMGVWCIGRILYVRGYATAAEKRELGFLISFLPTAVCTLGSFGVILWQLVA